MYEKFTMKGKYSNERKRTIKITRVEKDRRRYI